MKKLLWVLVGIQFTHVLDFIIMMPLAPQFIHTWHLSAFQFSTLLSAYTLAAAISGVLATAYVDRFNRRNLLLLVYALFILATAYCGITQSYHGLLVARFLSGLFGGILGGMVQTIIADTFPFEERGQAIGVESSAFSAATIAGVPLGLWLTIHMSSLSWHAPFLLIAALASAIWVAAYFQLPHLIKHLENYKAPEHPFVNLLSLLSNTECRKGLLFMLFMLMSSFSVIPYIAVHLTGNVGVSSEHLSWIYLAGGLATLFSAPTIGRLADHYGKRLTYYWLVSLSIIPLMLVTHLGSVSLYWVLPITTLFFVIVSGRSIPGMAIASALPPAQLRGSFMSLIAAIQMCAVSLASMLTGLLVTQNAQGQLLHYNRAGYLAMIFALLSIVLAKRIHLIEKNRP